MGGKGREGAAGARGGCRRRQGGDRAGALDRQMRQPIGHSTGKDNGGGRAGRKYARRQGGAVRDVDLTRGRQAAAFSPTPANHRGLERKHLVDPVCLLDGKPASRDHKPVSVAAPRPHAHHVEVPVVAEHMRQLSPNPQVPLEVSPWRPPHPLANRRFVLCRAEQSRAAW